MTDQNPFSPEVQQNSTIELLLMDVRVKVTDAAMEAIRRRCLGNIENLAFGTVYESKHVYGLKAWKALTASEARVVGKVIAHLAKARQLPLKFVSCRRCTRKYYERL